MLTWREVLRTLQNVPDNLLDDEVIIYNESIDAFLVTNRKLQQNTEDKDSYDLIRPNQIYITVN